MRKSNYILQIIETATHLLDDLFAQKNYERLFGILNYLDSFVSNRDDFVSFNEQFVEFISNKTIINEENYTGNSLNYKRFSGTSPNKNRSNSAN
jgi:hypothetical protein